MGLSLRHLHCNLSSLPTGSSCRDRDQAQDEWGQSEGMQEDMEPRAGQMRAQERTHPGRPPSPWPGTGPPGQCEDEENPRDS